MRKLIVATLFGTAAVLLMLYAQSRKQTRREAQRFDELCPEPPEDSEAS